MSNSSTAASSGSSASSLSHIPSSEPGSSAKALESMVDTAIEVIEQPLRMLRSGAVTDRHLAYKSSLLPSSSPGKHLRHVHDHLRILLASLDESPSFSMSEKSLLTINYDHRESAPDLENSVTALTTAFEDIQAGLRRLLSVSSGQVADPSRNGQDGRGALFDKEVELEATTQIKQKMRTTVGRELWFASLHSIHHYALARVILVNELSVEVGSSFGYAPSTLTRKEHRQRQQQQQEAQRNDSRKSRL